AMVDEAKALYNAANKIKSDEKYPQEQVNALNDFLKKLRAEAEEEAYQKIISKADELFNTKDWDGAEKLYTRANTLKSSDPYPPAQLKKINDARGNSALMDKYLAAVQKADAKRDEAISQKDEAK